MPFKGPNPTTLPTVSPGALYTFPVTWMNGCNVGGLTQYWATQLPLVNGSNGKALTQVDVDYLVSKGINTVRYLISQELMQSGLASNNQKYSNFNITNWNIFTTSVQLLLDANITVIIGRHQGLDQNFGCFEDVKFTAYGGDNPGFVLADFWRRIAQFYNSHPKSNLIMFDLDNEPLLGSSGQYNWWKIAQDCINAIRRTGSRNYIIVSGISYSGSVTWNSVPWNDPGGSGITNATAFLNLTDSLNGLISTSHCYMSASGSGSDTDVVSGTIGRTRLSNVVSWANSNATVSYHLVGEWANRPDVTNGSANISDFTNYLKDNSPPKGGKICGGLWWTFASYPFFNGYQFTLVPTGSLPGGADSVCMDALEAVSYFTLPTSFNPTTDAPNIYSYHRASDWTGSYIPDASGLAADTTKRLYNITTAGWTAVTYSSSDANFNNLPSIGNYNAGNYSGMVNNATLASAVDLATPIAGAATVYGVYWVVSPPASSMFLRQGKTMNGTTGISGSPGLWYYGNYQATRNNTNNVGGAVGSSTGKLIIICNVYNGASSATYVNSTTALATGNAGTTTISHLGVGNAVGQPAVWAMGEMLIYSSAHGSTDRSNVLNFLGSKYGITIV